MTKTTHGGRRDGAGPPRKLVEPIRVTITIEASDLEWLRIQHSRNWQDVIRQLISDHIENNHK